MLDKLRELIGAEHVLTGEDTAPWSSDWTGEFPSVPLAVLRPGTTEEVSAIMRLAHETGTPVVPVGGNTGLTGAAQAGDGALLLSVARLNRIRETRPDARVMVAEAGVILQNLHEAAEAEGLVFPLFFGARGSAMIGGCLSTNAGGSNVLRYGNTRALCLGIEAVLPDGRVMDLMSALHKDNSGYDLRDLMIGAEGTLGIITAAVLKLVPRPRAYATAMVAASSLEAALNLLNRLQDETGGQVEAFEYLSQSFMDRYALMHPEASAPFAEVPPVTLLVELGSTLARDADVGADGEVPLVAHLEEVLAALFEEGLVLDAQVARSEAQRLAMWARREAAAEVSLSGDVMVIQNDAALPLDKVAAFMDAAEAAVAEMAPDVESMTVGHLGDGNLHYTLRAGPIGAGMKDALVERIEEIVREMRGSFSAEHGIGQYKLPSMRRRKDPVALEVMRAIKGAVDPKGIMNPGKLLP